MYLFSKFKIILFWKSINFLLVQMETQLFWILIKKKKKFAIKNKNNNKNKICKKIKKIIIKKNLL
jgi:hypothetical protein